MADTLDKLVSQNSGSQPDRAAASVDTLATQDLIDQIVTNQSKMDSLKQQQADVPGTSDFLRSLPGILTMLGIGGAAAAGQGEAAAGFGQGLLGQIGADQKREQKLIGDDRKETLKILQGNQQRLSTMLNSRPEIFVDQEGNSLVDSRVLMYAATGYAMPINPGINYKLSKQNARTRQVLGVATKLLTSGDPLKAKQGGLLVESAIGTKLGDQFFKDIMAMDETERWNAMLGKANLDPLSVLSAWTYSIQNGKPMADVDVLGMIHAKVTPAKPLKMEDAVLTLAGEFNQRVVDGGPAVQNMPFNDQIDYVFGNTREGDAAVFRKFFMGTNVYETGLSGQSLLSMVVNAGDVISSVYRMQPNSPWLKQQGINSPEDIYSSKGVGAVLESGVAWAEEALADNTAQNYGIRLQDIVERLRVDNPDVTEASLAEYGNTKLNEFKAKATSATGRVDVDAFNRMVQEYVESPAEAE